MGLLDEPVTADFHLSEFIVSDTAARLGIDNTPPAFVLATLRNVLIPAMQGIRELLKTPVIIKSGFRCHDLNAAVRGSPSSDHLSGHAADFVSPAFGPPSAICAFLVERMPEVKFDTLIHEGGWVHISFAPRRRNLVLTAHFSDNGVTYTQGLT
jgi:putative chitinase